MWDACRLLWSLLVGLFRSRASLEAENLALRQQIIVLQCTAPNRLCFNTFDRLIFVGLYHCFRTSEMPWRSSDRDRHSLAPCWVPSLLALEVKAATGKTDGAA